MSILEDVTLLLVMNDMIIMYVESNCCYGKLIEHLAVFFMWNALPKNSLLISLNWSGTVVVVIPISKLLHQSMLSWTWFLILMLLFCFCS